MVIKNPNGDIFAGKRIGNFDNSWQMPQGGIDESENEDFAMFRELAEETGISKSDVNIINMSKDYYYYYIPHDARKDFWNGKYIGQKQRWYLLEFTGNDNSVNLNLLKPEFSEWKWISKERMLDLVVEFKKELYRKIIKEFF